MTRSGSSKPTNAWPSFEPLSLKDIIDSISIGKPRSSDNDDDAIAPSVRFPGTASSIDFSGNSAKPRWTWLGHASVLMQVPAAGNRAEPYTVLFDPIASQRCSPVSFFGPKRLTPFPCTIEDMGKIDLVVLSHDHHDHCDPSTIRQIEASCGETTMYAVPTGMDRTLRKIGIPNSRIITMQWWEEVVIDQKGSIKKRHLLTEPTSEKTQICGETDKLDEGTGTELVALPALSFKPAQNATDQDQIQEIQLVEIGGNEDKMAIDIDEEKESVKDVEALDAASTPLSLEDGDIKIACLPSQHNSLFRLWGNQSHWSSWLIQSRTNKETSTCYFGGDTGYRSRPDGPTCPVFRQIQQRYGSPDISFLPISVGAGLPYVEKITKGLVRISPNVARRFHATPDDAVSMLGDLGRGRAYGIHWGTWSTDKAASGTVRDLEAAKAANPESGSNFHLSKIGQWLYVE